MRLAEISQEIEEIKRIRLRYPHPLGDATKFKKKGENLISINFFPSAVKKGYVTESDIKNFQKKTTRDLERLEEIKLSLRDSKISLIYKNFYKKKINESIGGLLLLNSAAFIEATKGGYQGVNYLEKKLFTQGIDYFSNLLYGGPIKERKNEINNIKHYLNDLFFENRENLLGNEKEEFINFFRILFGESPLDERITKRKRKCRACTLLYKKLSPQNMKKIFKEVFSIYGIKEDIKITEEKSYIDFGDTGNFIPADKNYAVERILKLISHEIETHTIRKHNHPLKIGTKGNIIREEGLAMFNEEMTFSNAIKDHISSLTSFVTIYAAEIFEYQSLKNFLVLYKKLLKEDFSEKEIEKIIRRRKRYHLLELPGTNRKDIVYYRGYQTVLKHLKKGMNRKNFHRFFEGKIGINDFKIIDMLDESEKKDFIYPVRIGKILFYKLTSNRSNLDELKRKDFRFQHISHIDKFTREKINNIYQIIKNAT